jgi:hypothetical protein
MSDVKRCGNIRDGHPCGVTATMRLVDPTCPEVAYAYCGACWRGHQDAALLLGLLIVAIPMPATFEAAQ